MAELSTPPSEPVVWRFAAVHLGDSCLVRSRTWFAARHRAMALLGVERESLVWAVVDEATVEARNIVELEAA